LQLSLQSWRGHNREEFAEILSEVSLKLQEKPTNLGGRPGSILCSDRDERAVASARKNANLAELNELQFVTGDVLAVAQQVQPGTMIICNPPYGKRLSDCDGVKRLISLLQTREDLRPVAVLTAGAARE